jgi:hypothetical protein
MISPLYAGEPRKSLDVSIAISCPSPFECRDSKSNEQDANESRIALLGIQKVKISSNVSIFDMPFCP